MTTTRKPRQTYSVTWQGHTFTQTTTRRATAAVIAEDVDGNLMDAAFTISPRAVVMSAISMGQRVLAVIDLETGLPRETL